MSQTTTEYIGNDDRGGTGGATTSINFPVLKLKILKFHLTVKL